ncbi:MAG: hypothetical protein LLG04_15750 [Parachlamydia sp.]|nr:hypothetical protein [Parachlamydia sp.]
MIAQDLENYPASPLPADEDAQLVWQVIFAAAKIAQESFGNKEKPATYIGKFLEELELFA